MADSELQEVGDELACPVEIEMRQQLEPVRRAENIAHGWLVPASAGPAIDRLV